MVADKLGIYANEDGRTEGGAMKVVGFTALHYGRDYLAYAIRSIIDHVDEHHIAYTAIGSHGHRTTIPCPETRDELFAIAQSAAGSKLRWHDGEWPHEGAQRDSIHEYAPDATLIIVCDSDEIYHPSMLDEVVTNHLNQDGWVMNHRRIRVPMIHYWRSFYRCVLHDPALPVRFIFPQNRDSEDALGTGWKPVNHFGYAQRPEIVKYKLETHGHRNEIRHDVDWFNDVFMNIRRKTDLHLVGSEYWNYEDVNPWDYLPEFMKAHPYAFLDWIE
jgi:hypothetical protein